MGEQPHGYDFDLVGEALNEHECPICLQLLSEAVELPCEHLMCRECLIYLEEKALEENPNVEFRCSIDRQVYQRHEKKRNRPFDRLIKNSIKVKCRQWKQSCKWTGSISNYQEHHCNVCDWIEVECPHDGCDLIDIRKQILTHESSCKYRLVVCQYCGELCTLHEMRVSRKIAILSDHQKLSVNEWFLMAVSSVPHGGIVIQPKTRSSKFSRHDDDDGDVILG